MDIAKLRIQKKNEMTFKVKELTNKLNYNRRCIYNLTNSDMEKKFVSDKIYQAELIIKDTEVQIVEYTRKIQEIDLGTDDANIINSVNNNSKIASKKHEKTVIVKKNQQEKSNKNKKIMENVQSNERIENKKFYRNKREVEYMYRIYSDLCDKIPGYIQHNLETMPENKGYIFKGLYLYGKGPADSVNVTMFEKPNKNTLLIHEWTPELYSKYEKIGTDRKILKEQWYRNIKNKPVNTLSSYITV